MMVNDSVSAWSFEFTLFSDWGSLRSLFFSVCLLIYMTIISANVVIILTVCLETSLHQPMYIFICCLSLNSLYGSAGFFPRFLMDLLSDTHFISRPSCFTQIYIIGTYASNERTLLTVMAYDRLVAICQPLHYHSKMTMRKVIILWIVAVFYPLLACALALHGNIQLPLCGNKLHRLFCSNWPVVQLSCVDTTVNNVTGRMYNVINTFISLLFVLYTYLRILLVCKRNSSEFRRKALQTCLPHIVTFMIFSVSNFVDVSLSRFKPDEINPLVTVVLSLEFLIVPPINNPLVYGLNLPQIRGAIFRLMKIKTNRVFSKVRMKFYQTFK